MKRLTVLSVAYPLAPVGPDAVGGAEQVLTMLDTALVEGGHRSIVIACEGSRVAGELMAIARLGNTLDAAIIDAARLACCAAIGEALRRRPIDLVHMHGFDFDAYLPPPGVPVLATLHCPPDWYSEAALWNGRPRTYLNAVSAHQHARLSPNPRLLAPIDNGVDVDSFAGHYRKRRFALMLSRIAPEKGAHIALAASRRANRPLIVAGELFPYLEHQHYFDNQVRPHLDRERRFIGPVGCRLKRRLLGSACCALVCAQVPETSSLVAREAMAAGTPVIALRRGALVDTVDHGHTGFLVEDEVEMAGAIRAASQLDPNACRAYARIHFDAQRMIARYLQVYQELVRSHSHGQSAMAAGVR